MSPAAASAGRALVDRLAGQRRRDGGTAEGPLRLITVTEEPGRTRRRRRPLGQPDPRDADPQQGPGRRRQAAALLADAVDLHRKATRSGRRGGSGCNCWRGSGRIARGLARLFGLAGWSSLFGFRGLAAPGSIEQRYLRWSRARALR